MTVLAALILVIMLSFTSTQGSAKSDVVIATINVGSPPFGIAVSPNTDRIYVDNFASNSVSVIDGSRNNLVANITGVKTTLDFDLRTGVAVNPKTNTIYVTRQNDDLLYVVDGSSDAVIAAVNVGIGPVGIAVNPDTNKIYVANSGFHGIQAVGKSSISVLDGTTNTILKNIVVGSQPAAVAVNTNTNRIYASNFGSDSVSVIDGSTDSVVTNITGIPQPIRAAVNANTNRVYVSSMSGSLSVIDGSSNTIMAKIKVGSSDSEPLGVAVNPNSNKIYVVIQRSASVSLVDGSTNALVRTINVGNTPVEIAVNPDTNEIYVTNYNSWTVSVIDGSVPIHVTPYPSLILVSSIFFIAILFTVGKKHKNLSTALVVVSFSPWMISSLMGPLAFLFMHGLVLLAQPLPLGWHHSALSPPTFHPGQHSLAAGILPVSLLNLFRNRHRKDASGSLSAEFSDQYYVTGSGLVPVPKDRLNEIPVVLAEYHRQERDATNLLAKSRVNRVV